MSLRKIVPKNLIRQWDRTFCRYYSARKLTNAEVRKKRNQIFEEEKARQLSLITRIEKIKVEYIGKPECDLVMNKDLSTPYHCAMHLKELIMQRSVLAMVNGTLWDMHRPLVEDCTLDFLHFWDENPWPSNNAFWRTGSFTLGHILETAFKDDIYVELCSFPKPNVKSGSFVYDANLDTATNWEMTEVILRSLSRIGTQLSNLDLKFEPLEIDLSVAQTMFEDNQYKSKQIVNIAEHSKSGSKVKVYRMGDHIDISSGPMISSTSQIGRYRVASVHPIDSDYGPLQRVQGLALPNKIQMHYWSFDHLVKRAENLNKEAPFPYVMEEKKVFMAPRDPV